MIWVLALACRKEVVPDLAAMVKAQQETPPPTPPNFSPPLADALSWVIQALAGGVVTEADVVARFTPEFVAQVPPVQLLALFRELGEAWHPGTVELALEHQAQVVLEADGQRLRVTVAVDPADPSRISGLQLAPVAPEPAASWDALAERLQRQGRDLSLGVSELVTGASCVPVFDREGTVARPIASTFKLYVLATLAGEIAAGRASWDERLTVTDAVRSLPGGRLQDAPPNAEVSIREAATAMIAISDNTAADLLVGRVGAERIEATLAALGMAEPQRSTPFLTTRQLFVLKWGLGSEAAARYLGLGAAERRAMLTREVDGQPLPAVATVDPQVPVALGVEWWASTADLCRLWDTVLNGPEAAEVRKIVSANPGLLFEDWAFVGFKGGGEPGVLAGSWVLESAGGRRYVVSLALSDPARAVDETVLLEMLATDRLLAR